MSGAGLTQAERDILYRLSQAWNLYLKLPGPHPDDRNEFRQAVHTCQNLIAFRVASRTDPEMWWQPTDGAQT